MTQHIDPCDTARNNVIAAVLALQQCTKTAANLIPIPGTDRVIAIGAPDDVAELLGPARRATTPSEADELTQQLADRLRAYASNPSLPALLVGTMRRAADALTSRATTAEHETLAVIKAAQEHLVDVVRSFGDVSCAAYISTWHKPEQIAAAIAGRLAAAPEGATTAEQQAVRLWNSLPDAKMPAATTGSALDRYMEASIELDSATDNFYGQATTASASGEFAVLTIGSNDVHADGTVENRKWERDPATGRMVEVMAESASGCGTCQGSGDDSKCGPDGVRLMRCGTCNGTGRAPAPSRDAAALLAELDWCIAEGHSGPRTLAALTEARAALAQQGAAQGLDDLTCDEIIARTLDRVAAKLSLLPSEVSTDTKGHRAWGRELVRAGAAQAQAGDVARDAALEEAANVAERFGPNRPIVTPRPSERIHGRWEGEQAASSTIAALIRGMKSDRAAMDAPPTQGGTTECKVCGSTQPETFMADHMQIAHGQQAEEQDPLAELVDVIDIHAHQAAAPIYERVQAEDTEGGHHD